MKLYDIFVKDLDWALAGEVVLRTIVMFLSILIMLRLSGKKGVRQLSIFEVAIIIALGSAAGDPMFITENAIIPSIIVFASILGLYRLITWLSSRFERFESIVEGDPVYLIESGEFVLHRPKDTTFAKDEFFAELRSQNIEHLGQIREAVLETNGSISILYFEDEQVRPGLPLWPKAYGRRDSVVTDPGNYACTNCGHVAGLGPGTHRCSRCAGDEWASALKSIRKS